jgi:hypothetical protein
MSEVTLIRPDVFVPNPRLASIAHDLSCVNGIELGGGLDALNALLDVNADWGGNIEAPLSRRQFVALLDCVRTQVQGAKNKMESLICDLEREVAHAHN